MYLFYLYLYQVDLELIASLGSELQIIVTKPKHYFINQN